MKYRALIFDFDGTIADTLTESFRIYNELAPDYGLREISEDELLNLRHLSLKEILKELKIPKRKLPSILARGTGLMRKNLDNLQPIPGMKEALISLKPSVEIFGILTSNSTANVDTFLKNHGVRDLFEFISSTSKLTGKARYLRAIRKTFSLQHEKMLFIGDELRDVKAAQRANIPHAAVTWGFNSKKILKASSPTYLVNHPSELAELLG